jgi:hypothetical protein
VILLNFMFLLPTVLALLVFHNLGPQVVHKKKKKAKVDSDDEMEAVGPS